MPKSFNVFLLSALIATCAVAQNQIPSVDIARLTVLFQPDADAYYPSFSKRQGEQGSAAVRLIIDESGSVTDALLLQSSGFPRLDRGAVEIGRRYRFKPYMVDGNAEKISTNLLIKFNLKLPESFKGAQFVEYANLKVLSTPVGENYYPLMSKELGEEGVINLRLLIDPEGNVIEAIPFGKIEYERLRLAAIEIAKRTKFSPYLAEQKAVKIQTLTTVSFPPKDIAK